MFRGRTAIFDRLSGVFDNALIDRRHTVAPLDWYRETHGWEERNDLYVSATEALFEEVGRKAIDRAGLTPEQIDGVVGYTLLIGIRGQDESCVTSRVNIDADQPLAIEGIL